MKICTFCGHGNLETDPAYLMDKLTNALVKLIDNGFDTFYCGYYGEFDVLCSTCVNELKNQYPDIMLCAITPYPDDTLTKHSAFMAISSDELIYPFDGQKVHPRFAIPKRNSWMVEQADIVVSYINHTHGGAYKTYTNAKKLGKKVINLGSLVED